MINKALIANIPEKLSGQEKLSLVLKKVQQIINPQKISKATYKILRDLDVA